MKCFFTFSFLLLMGITLSLRGQVVPVFTIEKAKTTASTSTVSITSVGFSNVSSGNLKILYNPSVAIPVEVTVGADLGGSLSFNLSNKGEIIIGWFTFPAVTLKDGSVIFNIKFDRVSLGTAVLGFDEAADDLECQFYNGSYQNLNDAPFSTYYKSGSITFDEHLSPITKAPNLTVSNNDNINVPITVQEFNNIGAVSLRLEYDPDVLKFNSASNTGGFPNLIIYKPSPGILTISGTTNSTEGFSLPDGSVFFTLNFAYQGGVAGLSWFDDDGASCEYAGPKSAFKLTDTPQSNYYINGSVVSNLIIPAITAGDVKNPSTCTGEGTIPLTFTNVPDGTYTIDYDGGSFPNIAVLANAATITAPAGTYNNLRITVDGVTSAVGVNAGLIDPVAPDSPVVEAIIQPGCTEATGSVLLSGLPAGGWTINPGNITGTTANTTIYNLTEGTYSFSVTNEAGCISPFSENIIINAQPTTPTTPIIEASGPTTFCTGGSVTLSSSESSTYRWSNGELTQSIIVTASGKYTVTVSSEEGCSATSEAMLVTVNSPEKPDKQNCWDEFVLNPATCTWENKGIEPVEPTPVNCWDDYQFNSIDCVWENKGTQPLQPNVACYETVTWNESNCEWDISGIKSVEPDVACYETATWNATDCLWQIMGEKPHEPELECYQTATWNDLECNWEIDGTQPVAPDVACYQTANWNNVDCVWDISGTKPVYMDEDCNIIATWIEPDNRNPELLIACFPNPFREDATIKFTLPENGIINLEVTGILGNRISIVSYQKQNSGEYLMDLEGAEFVPGVYQITLRFTNENGKDFIKTLRMIKQ